MSFFASFDQVVILTMFSFDNIYTQFSLTNLASSLGFNIKVCEFEQCLAAQHEFAMSNPFSASVSKVKIDLGNRYWSSHVNA